MMIRLYATALLVIVAGCAPKAQSVPGPEQADAVSEPAPTPRTMYLRQSRTVRGPESPLLTKMPLGTGAVPVSNGPVRGSVAVGLREAF